MVKHIVMWRFKEFAEGSSKQVNMEKAKRLLEDLNGTIADMIHLEVAIRMINADAPCDMVLYSEFKSRSALERYQSHPLHRAVADFLGKVRNERTVIDYEV